VLGERDVGRAAALLWGTLSVGASLRAHLPTPAGGRGALARWVRRGLKGSHN